MRVLMGILWLMCVMPLANAQEEQKDQKDQEVFIKTEEQIIRDLKLLNLEVEKAKLQLKKQQMLTKLNKLSNHTEVSLPVKDSDAVSVTGILISSANKVALLTINGEQQRMAEQQQLPDGSVVKEIKADGVVLLTADGKSRFIKFVKGV